MLCFYISLFFYAKKKKIKNMDNIYELFNGDISIVPFVGANYVNMVYSKNLVFTVKVLGDQRPFIAQG